MPLDFLAAMQRALPWADRAACRDEPDWRTFFPDKTLDKPNHIGSPTLLLPLLICAGCPVRRECLQEALSDHGTVRVDIASNGKPIVVSEHGMPTVGTWGGTTEIDRLTVAGLSPPEGAEILERTFEQRLRRRVRAYRKRPRALPRSSGGWRVKRIEELLGSR